MRVIIFTMPNHIYANYVVRSLLMAFTSDIVAIFESTVMSNRRPFFQAIERFWRVSGPEYVFWQGVKQTFFRIGSLLNTWLCAKDSNGVFYSYKRMAKAEGIPIHHSADVNQEADLAMIRGLRPDIIVSVFFTQIIRQPLLNIPTFGCINIHPAYLPRYRGVSPAFWTLVNGESHSGVTVHCIDEGIDTGRILARRRVPIIADDTEHSLYLRSAQIGVPLLVDVLKKLKGEGRLGELADKGQPENHDISASYYSIPTRAAVKVYDRRGRPFFRWGDFCKKL